MPRPELQHRFYVALLTASDPNKYQLLTLYPTIFTPSTTFASVLTFVAEQAKGDNVQFFWSKSPLRSAGDVRDLREQCIRRFGTMDDMEDNAMVCAVNPEDTCGDWNIEASEESRMRVVQLIALIRRKPVDGSRPSSERLESIHEHVFAPEHILNQARKRPTPSKGAATSLFMKNQRTECADAAYDSRPFALTPSPVIIYDRTLAQFLRHITIPTSEFSFTKEEFTRARKFATVSSEWYATEALRQTALEPIVAIGGDPMFNSVTIYLDDGTHMIVDGDISISHDGQRIRLVFSELKKGAGTALNQVELYYMKLVASSQYARVWRESCCPMILIVVIDNTISVWGAVFGDRFMFEPLSLIHLGPSTSPTTTSPFSPRQPASTSDLTPPPPFNLEHQNPTPPPAANAEHPNLSPPQPSHPVREDRWGAGIREIAKLLRCLDHAVHGLKCFYRGLQLPVGPTIPQSTSRGPSRPNSTTLSSPPQARFPFWRSFTTGDGSEYDLHYISRLTDDISKPVFKARMASRKGGSPVDVVVKFALSYGEEGHRLLATHEYAPTLHYCNYERDIGMWVVVMDFVDGKSPSEGSSLTPAHSQSLKSALDLLHENDLVFGDLREPNIIISQDSLMLLDLDWCAKEGVGRYPATINLSGEIQWHAEVYGGQVLNRQHDLYRWKLMSGEPV